MVPHVAAGRLHALAVSSLQRLQAPGTPEEFAAFIRAEIARWKAVLKRAGVTAQ